MSNSLGLDYNAIAQAFAQSQAPAKAPSKGITSLLAELGGDSPQTRSIAEGLQKQGISSIKDIGVTKVPVAGHFEGTDEAAHYVPETTQNAYFNKVTGSEINPTRLGVYQVDKDGKAQGDIFFHLNADDNGNIKFDPQWNPRAHGFLRDNAVGQLIMKAGAIIPNPFQAGFVAANVGDALAHEKYAKALLAATPYGFQELGGMDALKGALGFGPSGIDMGEVIPQGGIADYLPSGLDMGDVIPKGGIADYLPASAAQADELFEQLVNPASTIPATSFDQFSSELTQPSSGDFTTMNAVDNGGLSAHQLSDVSNGLDMGEVIPPEGIAEYLPNGLDMGDVIPQGGIADYNLNGLDTGDVIPQGGIGEYASRVDANGNSRVDLAGTKFDLNGNPINDSLTLGKVLDIGGAYLSNPTALIGTGLAVAGLMNKMTDVNKLVDATKATDAISALTSSQAPGIVSVGSTPGLQDLFNYTDLYKSSPFQQTTQPKAQTNTQPQTQPIYPGFTVSDLFKSLMAEAPPKPKIEPNLVGLAGLQQKMTEGKP